MEPTDARKAYPCFDEPALKVEYTTVIEHQDKYNALSNMNIKVGAFKINKYIYISVCDKITYIVNYLNKYNALSNMDIKVGVFYMCMYICYKTKYVINYQKKYNVHSNTDTKVCRIIYTLYRIYIYI